MPLQPDYQVIAALSHKFDTIGFHVLNLVMIKILLPTAETLHHAMALTKNQPQVARAVL